jgi:hypothetical protein
LFNEKKIIVESFILRNLLMINTAAGNNNTIYKGIYYSHYKTLERIQNKITKVENDAYII